MWEMTIQHFIQSKYIKFHNICLNLRKTFLNAFFIISYNDDIRVYFTFNAKFLKTKLKIDIFLP